MASVDFVISAFESSLVLSTSALLPSTGPDAVDSSLPVIALSTEIHVSDIQNAFYFKTDKYITGVESDVHYFFDQTKWDAVTSQQMLNPTIGLVTGLSAHSVTNDDTVGKDFLRDLAKQLFGTILGVDLFTNEDLVVSDIDEKCSAVSDAITAKLTSINNVSGTHLGLVQEVDGSMLYFLDDSSSDNSNIGRELLNQIMISAPDRLVALQTDLLYNATDDGYYRTPIAANDTLSFKLTIHPSLDQRAAVQTSDATLVPRDYVVTLKVIADAL